MRHARITCSATNRNVGRVPWDAKDEREKV